MRSNETCSGGRVPRPRSAPPEVTDSARAVGSAAADAGVVGSAGAGSAGAGSGVADSDVVGPADAVVPTRPAGSGGRGAAVLVRELAEVVAELAALDVSDDGLVALDEAESLLHSYGLLALAIEQRVARVQSSKAYKTAGFASVPAWLRAKSGGRMGKHAAGVMRRDATQFQRLPRVVAALLQGRISHDMARAIAAAMTCLGPKADPGVVAETENTLLTLALDEKGTPEKVALVGRHLRNVLNPDGELSDEDKAYGNRYLISMVDDKGGMTGRFYLPPEAAAKLQQVLDAYGRPGGGNDDRTKAQRNVDAFIALLNGKVSTQITVLVNAETLPDTPAGTRPAVTGPESGTGRESTGPECTGLECTGPECTGPEITGPESSTGQGDGAGGLGYGNRQDHNRGGHGNGGSECDNCGSEDNGGAHVNGSRERDNGGHHGNSSAGRSNETIDEWGEPDLDEQAMERLRVAMVNLGQAPPGTADRGGGQQEADPLPCPTCDRPANRNTPGLLMPTGHPLPAKHVHRLLYTSQLFRVVVDARSRVVDAGYSTRFVPEWMRRIVHTRYDTCSYDDCPVEAKYCDMDHVFNWADFHRTRADEIIPACGHHNRDRAEHPGKYRLEKLPDGRWHFTTVNRRG